LEKEKDQEYIKLVKKIKLGAGTGLFLKEIENGLHFPTKTMTMFLIRCLILCCSSFLSLLDFDYSLFYKISLAPLILIA
jgi:hypothetical protein